MFVDPSESTVDSIRNREAEMITRKLMHSWLNNISWVEKDKCTTKCMNREVESRLLSIQEHLNTRGKTITRKNIVRFLECNLCIETKINIKNSLFFPLVCFCLFLCLFGLFIYLFFADFFFHCLLGCGAGQWNWIPTCTWAKCSPERWPQ